MKYAGIGNTKNAILNTAYKGQKTVQTHWPYNKPMLFKQQCLPTSTNDMKVHNSIASVDLT